MADITTEKHGRVTIFTLNRPKQHNSLTRSMRGDLEEAVQEFNTDPEQYVGIVTGAGEKAFCSGADIKEMAIEVENGSHVPISSWPDIGGIANCEKPLIAAINGLAVGAGFEIALSCDIRIASMSAWFGLFETKVGVVPGIGANILPRLLPMGVAMDMLFASVRVEAKDAYRLGLVQKLAQPEGLMEAAMNKAETIAANSQSAVCGTKKIAKFWRDLALAEQQAAYETVAHQVLLSGDVKEGTQAFAEKRPPKFNNR